MDACHYRFSALLALAAHAVATVGLGGLLVWPPTAPQRIQPVVTLDLPALGSEAAGDSRAAPRNMELPRLRPRTTERIASAPLPPPETLPNTIAAAHVARAETTPASGAHAGNSSTKAVFLASLAAAPDAPAGPDQPAGSDAVAGNGDAGVDALPAPRTPIRPLYPVGARRRGEAGQVVLDARVAADGRAGQVTLLAPSGFTDLDQAAEHAVKRALFKPAIRGGRPVEARVRITILFRLTD
jgi:protein TonB